MPGNRRSIRLQGYDYTQPGAYFVTICARNRVQLFGRVEDETVVLSAWGEIVDRRWRAIPEFFPQARLDTFAVMPNHVHGILWIVGDDVVETGHLAQGLASAPPSRPKGADAGSLGAMIGNFKSTTTRIINQQRGAPGAAVWQRNYYEHIIRTNEALAAIQQYILENPQRWSLDRYHPDPTGVDPRAAEIWRLLRRHPAARA